MNISTRYEKGEPFEGNRSAQFLGVALFFEQEFFHEAKSSKFGKSYPDTRIKLFPRKPQESQRVLLMNSASSFGIQKQKAEITWMEIVKSATLKTTDFVKSKTHKGMTRCNPLSLKENSNLISLAFHVGLKEIAGDVCIMNICEQWDQGLMLDFEKHDESWVYVRKDNPYDDYYKIGRTTRKEMRDSSYKTHSAHSEIVTEFRESGLLSERNIHLFFSKRKSHLEFFQLTEEDVLLLKKPLKLKRLISQMHG
jgi:hypothetical protein